MIVDGYHIVNKKSVKQNHPLQKDYQEFRASFSQSTSSECLEEFHPHVPVSAMFVH